MTEPAATKLSPAGRWEFFLLVALAFVLPLYEAPKNIVGTAFFLVWLVNRVRAKEFGGPWRAWDTVLAISIAANVLVTAFAGLKGGEWVGLRDVVRTLLLMWCLMRAGYTRTQWGRVLAALIAGTVVAVAGGAWKLYASQMEGLELHSVGHANHSASYLCIVFGVALAFLAGCGRTLSVRNRLLLLAALAICGIAIVLTGSRVAVVCAAFLTLLVGALHLRHSWRPLVAAVGVIGIAALLVVAADPWVLRKHVRNVKEENVLAYRDQIWERATTAWRAYPLFGIGMDNFSRITNDQYRQWTEAQGRAFDAKRSFTSSHAHSLYFDTLAERGLIGAAALLLFVAGWVVSLWRGRPRADDGFGMAVQGSAAAALFVTLFIGLVNTTLHNEQFAAAMICLGAWVAWTRGSPGGTR
jgi:O-antigen ligase